jgi:four helix bundle protein
VRLFLEPSAASVSVVVDVSVSVSVNVYVDGLTMDTQTLSYKKLEVYQSSIQFLDIALRLVSGLPKGQAKLADQFRRASLSIPLNIAEAAGKVSPAEAAHHFAIARGSAMECGAILDVFKLMGVGQKEVLVQGDGLLVRMVSMLTRMCR